MQTTLIPKQLAVCPRDRTIIRGFIKEYAYDEQSEEWTFLTTFVCAKCGTKVLRFSDD